MKLRVQTYRKIIFVTLLLFSLLINSFDVQSQTIAGGEIYYKIIGKKSFEIEANIYRICNTAPLNSINAYVISDSIRIPIQFTRVSINKINDTCNNPCNLVNSTSNYGFERHQFKGFVDFNSNTYDTFIKMNKCIVNFAILENKRETAVNTHSSGNFYIDAEVNICDTLIQQNTSPRFTLDPKFKGLIGDATRYSPGPSDSANCDSLAFSMAPIQYDYNKYLNYSNLFTYKVPVSPFCPHSPGNVNCPKQPDLFTPTGFYFDSIGCQIVFTPASENLGYVKFKVKEFRKINGQWHYIGFTSREMLFKSYYGGSKYNYSSVLTSAPKGPILPICSGNSILEIKSTDYPNFPNYIFDTTHLFWNQTFKNGQFKLYDTLLNKSVRIELPFNSSLIDKHQYFSVSTYDQMCNEKLVSKTYVGINRSKIPYSSSINVDSCNVFTYKINPIDTTLTYSSEVSIFNKNKVLIDQFSENRTYAILIDSGIYFTQIKMTITGMNCPIYHIDTIQIGKQIPRVQFPYPRDTTVCSSYPAQFSISTSNLPGLNTYTWFKNDSIALIDSSKFQTTIYGNTKIALRMYFNDGCFSEYNSNFQSKKYSEKLLANTYGGDVCPMDSFSINGFPLNANQYKKPYNYIWTLYDTQWTRINSPFKFQVKSEEKIKLRFIDDNHCVLEDSTYFYPKAYIMFDLRSDKIQNCLDSNIQFTTVNTGKKLNAATTQWVKNETDTTIIKNYTRNIQLTSNTKMKVTMSAYGCSFSDSIDVKAIQNPMIEIDGPTKSCSSDTTLQTLKLDSFNGHQQIKWYLNNLLIDSGSIFIKTNEKKSFDLKAIAIRENLCSGEYQKNIVIVPNPSGNMIGPDKICSYEYAQFKLEIDTFSGNQRIVWLLDSMQIDSNINSILVKKVNSFSISSLIMRDSICHSEFTKSTTVFPQPDFNILGDSFYHYSNFIRLKTDKLFESYLWSNSSTNQNNEFWATELGQAGQYIVWCKVTDSNNCISTDTITLFTNKYTGLTNDKKYQLMIFPNPSSGKFYIISNIESEYTIVDVSGRIVSKGQILIDRNNIDLSTFSSGVYFLKIGDHPYKLIKH